MENLRAECHSLNLFTTDQLVWLSQDLAKVNQGKNIMNSASMMMLRLVAPNASDKELQRFVVDHLRAYLHHDISEEVVSNMEVDLEMEDDSDDDPLIDLKVHNNMFCFMYGT